MDEKNDSRSIIGRSAEIIFVDHNSIPIPAKIDTGAYRSAIHASNIRLDENNVLHFRVCGDHPACADESAFDISTSEYEIINIENSFGDSEDRYEVKLRIKIADEEFKTSFTLANRQKKIYPILLGRLALKNRYIVDVDKSGVDRIALKEKYHINLPGDEEQEYN